MIEFQFHLEHLLAVFFLGVSSTILFYWYTIKNHDYWRKRGVPYVMPLPLVGTELDYMRQPTQDVEISRYRKLGPVYGLFLGNEPQLSIADPKLLKDILLKDFSYFTSRLKFDTGDKIHDSMLLSLQGETWKRVRAIITPTFTTLKIKRMLNIFKDSSKTLEKNFTSAMAKEKHVDVIRLFQAFSMDVIASSAFSTKIDSHNNPDNMFVKTARKAFTTGKSWITFLLVFAPQMFKLLWYFTPKKHEIGGLRFFEDVVCEIVKERRRTGQVRDDFIQLLMDTGKEVEVEEKSEKEDFTSNYGENSTNPQRIKNLKSKSLSMDELVSQCVMFFLVGYETSASTLSFATYFLALHQDIQDKLRAEVLEALNATKNELTYDAVQNMKYLDNVISETLRLFPIATRFYRIADADYKLGDTGIIVPKGMTVGVPAIALHMDPKYFPDPEKFDPERFSPEERSKRQPYTYLPFGSGPRSCIGMRFALLEIKVCLAHIISTFNIKRSLHTKVPLQFRPELMHKLLQPEDIILELEERTDEPLV